MLKNILDFKKIRAINSFMWSYLKRSISFWITGILFLVGPVVATATLLTINKTNIFNLSVIILSIELFLMFVFLFILTLKIFSDSKYSNIDLILVSKAFSRTTIYFSRYIFIFVVNLLINFVQFVILTIVFLSFNLSSRLIGFYFVSNVLINPFVSILIVSFFILFAICLNKIWFALSSLLVIISTSVLPIAVRATNINNEPTIQYSNTRYNSFSKLTYIKDNEVKTFLVDKINPSSSIDVNENILANLNSDKIYNYFIPGEWINSFYSSLMKDLFHDVNNYDFYPMSIIKTKYINQNVVNVDYDSLLALRPNDINPFTFSNIDYENLIVSELKNISNDSSTIDLSDSALVEYLFNKINNVADWKSSSLSIKEENTLKALLGINAKYNQLFYYFNYYWTLNKKTPDIAIKINNIFNEQLSTLMNYLWNSPLVWTNIFSTNYFGNIDEIYPNDKSINFNYKPIEQDVQFIMNDLIRFNQNNVYYLDSNQKYVQTNISTLQNISSNITDESSWKQYVVDNTLTYQDAINLLQSIENNITNVFRFSLHNNYVNPYQYSLYLVPSTATYLSYNSLVWSMTIFLSIVINIFAHHRFVKTNYKNINY